MRGKNHHYHNTSVCALLDLAVPASFARHASLVRNNLTLLEKFFAEFSGLFEWYRPEGGCVAFPKFLGHGSTDQFCEDLVAKSGVLLLPPRIFYSELLDTPGNRFRIGYGRRNLAEGLDAFSTYLRSSIL